MEATPESAELHRDVLSALAHELGGIASALDLRAAAMARAISENDLRALRDIAEQVRLATRAARLARGSDGYGMLNPMRRQSLDEWWKLNCRFTTAVLPRGVSIESEFSPAQITATGANSLTWIWLAACKELGERGLLTPARLVLRGSTVEGDAVALSADLDADRLTLTEKYRSRWSRFTGRVAKGVHASAPVWERTDSVVRWRFVLPP